MLYRKYRWFILVYLLSIAFKVAQLLPLEQAMPAVLDEEKEQIPAIYNTPPQPPVKILREAGPITEKETMKLADDMQQSESYTYSYYRPLYSPGVYYSYYPRYRWYRPYYYYNWWYY